jgi:hypothetical protein
MSGVYQAASHVEGGKERSGSIAFVLMIRRFSLCIERIFRLLERH